VLGRARAMPDVLPDVKRRPAVREGRNMPKVYMDEAGGVHLTQRIRERIPTADQAKMIAVVNRLRALDAPREAVGEYQWHVNVERIGRVVLRGHMIRTVYSFDERYPNSPEYKIAGNQLVRV
jgi:hypothetical protein